MYLVQLCRRGNTLSVNEQEEDKQPVYKGGLKKTKSTREPGINSLEQVNEKRDFERRRKGKKALVERMKETEG